MTHASLFTGIGACELAARRMGWENLFSCEIDPFCNRVLEYHYPDERHYGDIRNTDFGEWRGKVNVLTGGFPCFTAGTPVLTGRGFARIEDVDVGETVLSKDGEYHKVVSFMRHEADRITLMRAQGMWEPMKVTPNHRFWIMREKYRGFHEPEWIPIGEAKVGDRIGYPIHEGTDTSHTPEFWRMVGLWIADGWIQDSRRKDRINCYNHKTVICCGKKNITRLHHTIQKAGFKYTLSEERTTFKAIICDEWLCDFMKGFGKYAHGKHLSPQCFTLDNVRKSALLEGMMADGFRKKNGGYTITTVSRELALGIAQIARDVYRCPVSITKKTSNRECVIEGRKVNEHPQYQVTISHSTRYGGYRDGLVWCNIKSLETRDEINEVYNLEIEDEHTYNVYGIAVHNCQPFSCAGGRKGTEDDRYLWPRMLEVIRQVRPDWVVGENVAGILSMVFPGEETAVGGGETLFGEDYTLRELRQRYVADSICEDLEREGYAVLPVVIPACAVGAPHERKRVWFVANRDGASAVPGRLGRGGGGCDRGGGLFPDDSQRDAAQGEPAGDGRLYRAGEDGRAGTAPHADHDGGQETSRRGRQEDGESDGQSQSRVDSGIGAVALAEGEQGQRGEPQLGEARGTEQGKPGGGGREDGRGREGVPALPQDWWRDFPTQSPVCGGDDGLSARLLGITFPKWRQEAIKALGNSMCVAVVYELFRAIQIVENGRRHGR